MVLNYWFLIKKGITSTRSESQDLKEPQLPRFRKRSRRLDDGAWFPKSAIDMHSLMHWN